MLHKLEKGITVYINSVKEKWFVCCKYEIKHTYAMNQTEQKEHKIGSLSVERIADN